MRAKNRAPTCLRSLRIPATCCGNGGAGAGLPTLHEEALSPAYRTDDVFAGHVVGPQYYHFIHDTTGMPNDVRRNYLS